MSVVVVSVVSSREWWERIWRDGVMLCLERVGDCYLLVLSNCMLIVLYR